MKLIFRKNWLLISLVIILIYISFVDITKTEDILLVSWKNVLTMLSFVPPIFILIGLLDVFVSKEFMIKHMGPDSGLLGFLYVALLGGLAAGPLYMAFPISAILLKKKANIRYVVFFLGMWSTLKLPILIYEFANFGFVFTMTNIVVALVLFIFGSYLFEYILSKNDKLQINENAVKMIKN